MLNLILSPTFTNNLTITGNNIPLKNKKYFQLNVKGETITSQQIINYKDKNYCMS